MDTDTLAERAAFYLTLSQAFQPPQSDAVCEAFVERLPGDLAEFGDALGHPIADAAGFLARALAALTPLALRQRYSGLFLQPPRLAHLNASLYLDGAIAGRHADVAALAYARHGLARAEAFHDLPDHLAIELEFLAVLYARAARRPERAAALASEAQDFIRSLLLPWVPLLGRRLREIVVEQEFHPAYVHLTEIAQQALIADAGELPDALRAVIDPEQAQAHRAREREMATCRECGADIAPAGRLPRVKKVLAEQGIDTSHLDLCMDCRGSPKELLERVALCAGSA